MPIDRDDNALEHSMALMSAMSTAADLVAGMAERRNGIDPTAQEAPDVARPYLRAAAEELGDQLAALRAGRALVVDDDASRMIGLARRVNEMLLLNRIVRLFHSIHQRLLSLYPAVPDELVEQARILEDLFADDRDRGTRAPRPHLLAEAEIFHLALHALD
jgi:hypothetical protein